VKPITIGFLFFIPVRSQ